MAIMPQARKRIIDPSLPTWVHCTSRCVRRAFLCGGTADHRRGWLEERLCLLAGIFAVEIAGYAIMENHLHVIVRMQPRHPSTWSEEEVARRWYGIYPADYFADGTPKPAAEALIQSRRDDHAWVGERRKRLADLGWFMKALKEAIARRANREDGCTGAFWEGRFHSVPLLDQAALIACMAYVDLNPVRARIAETPESSIYTSAYRRIEARNRHLATARANALDTGRAECLPDKAGLSRAATHPEDGLWLCPLSSCVVGEELGNRRVDVDDYLMVLDATGRLLKPDKRGCIPSELPPILTRLDLSVEAWLATMQGWRMFAFTSAVGSAAVRAMEAGRRHLRWIRSRCPLFGPRKSAQGGAA
jgi:REP element-mobilizing transposase RayT